MIRSNDKVSIANLVHRASPVLPMVLDSLEHMFIGGSKMPSKGQLLNSFDHRVRVLCQLLEPLVDHH